MITVAVTLGSALFVPGSRDQCQIIHCYLLTSIAMSVTHLSKLTITKGLLMIFSPGNKLVFAEGKLTLDDNEKTNEFCNKYVDGALVVEHLEAMQWSKFKKSKGNRREEKLQKRKKCRCTVTLTGWSWQVARVFTS